MDNIYKNMPEQAQPQPLQEQPQQPQQPQNQVLDKYEEKDVFGAIPFSVIKEILGERRGSIGPDGIYNNYRTAEEVVREAYSLIRDIMVSRMYSVKKRFIFFTDDSYKNEIKKLEKLIRTLESKMKINSNTIDKTVNAIANVVDSIKEKHEKADKEYDQRVKEDRMLLLDEYIKDTMICIRITQEIKNSIDPRVYNKTMNILYEIRGYLNLAIYDGFSEEAHKCYEEVAKIITQARALAIRGVKSAMTTTTELEKALNIVKERWTKRNKIIPKVTNRVNGPQKIPMKDAISTVKEYDDVVVNAETLFYNARKLVERYSLVSADKKKEVEKYKNQKDELYDKLDQIDELALSGYMKIDEHFDESYKIKEKIYNIQDRIWDLEEDIEADEIDAENMEEKMRVFSDMEDLYVSSKIKGIIPEIVTMLRAGDGMNYELLYTSMEQWDALTDDERIVCEETIREFFDAYVTRSVELEKDSEIFRNIRQESRIRKQKRDLDHGQKKIERIREREEQRLKRDELRAKIMDERMKAEREYNEQKRKYYEQRQNQENQPDRESEYLANLNEERNARHAQRNGRDPFDEPSGDNKNKKRFSDSGNIGDEN